MKFKEIILLLIFVLICDFSSSQTSKKFLFTSISVGTHMSGIKKQDFIHSNFSPLYSCILGVKLKNEIEIITTYRGYNFKYINDSANHNFHFLSFSAKTTLSKITSSSLSLHEKINFSIGGGILKNNFADKYNLCLDIASFYKFLELEKFDISLILNSIVGWKIYQHNEDILNGISICLTKKI